ncbi:MAG: amidohydrolase [Pirellulaceae bacterium]|nr:amidohydrolase [Pirellulaceae bacterium]
MNDNSDSTTRIDAVIDGQFSLMRDVRRYLHANPEPSGEESNTAALIVDQLRSIGLQPKLVANDCGVIVDSDGDQVQQASSDNSRHRIAVRADTDALRIQDIKNASYASCVPGIMHACGHDVHTATVLGMAVSLAKAQQDGLLPATVRWRAIFQPEEENNRGALKMVDAGCLDGVQAIIALHVDPSRDVGTVGTRTGSFTADCVALEVVISGRGGHAARPHESFDPIAAAAQLISSVYLFIPRRVDTQEPVVVSFGQINGGNNSNVIPDRVVLRGTMRTLSDSVTVSTLAHIRRLAQGIADASQTQIEVSTTSGPPAVHNDSALNALIKSSAQKLLGAENVQAIRRPSMGGEDFANYLSTVPGAMFRLGCKKKSGDTTLLHSPDFDIDETAMSIGAKILARTVIAWNQMH